MHNCAGTTKVWSGHIDFKLTLIKYDWKQTFYKGKEEFEENVMVWGYETVKYA